MPEVITYVTLEALLASQSSSILVSELFEAQPQPSTSFLSTANLASRLDMIDGRVSVNALARVDAMDSKPLSFQPDVIFDPAPGFQESDDSQGSVGKKVEPYAARYKVLPQQQ